jgi:hypothetical protein
MDRQQPQPAKHQYRGFIFVVHPLYGLLMLHCTRKHHKQSHFQIPGGHIDEIDYSHASTTADNVTATAGMLVSLLSSKCIQYVCIPSSGFCSMQITRGVMAEKMYSFQNSYHVTTTTHLPCFNLFFHSCFFFMSWICMSCIYFYSYSNDS